MQAYLVYLIISLHMIQYTSQYQTKIDDFSSLHQLKLNPNNRWIQLSFILPWDNLVKIYSKKFNQSSGAKAISPRIIIGALIIKHKLNLSDEETLQTISENPYMQFFLGLDDYSPEILFSPSLFVEIRKRLGQDTFNEFSELIMSLSLNPSSTQKGDEQPSNQGKLKIDATVADQYIRYPNDLSLVNEARLKSEKIIDQLYILLKDEFPVKPRTYRKVAHQRYLQEAKKKQKSAKSVRKAIRYLLNCVERNLRYIDAMLDKFHGVEFPLANKYQKRLWVIHTLYDQQRKMYDEKSHTCTDRIVSISQPHVRPIVRGKQGKPVEFGSKLGLSLIDGYMIHETLSWEAYNESKDLQKQAETYKLLLGYYPELIQADKIYATNENRIWCKERNIRLTATPKGRPAKKTAAQIRKEKKEYAERNHIEGRIGNAKQSFSLNQIKAKLKETSSTWIAVTIFVMNLSRFANLLNS
jgi:IS5 family transposase